VVVVGTSIEEAPERLILFAQEKKRYNQNL
jgi:hypothetical protein